jgi:hypothetical protein
MKLEKKLVRWATKARESFINRLQEGADAGVLEYRPIDEEDCVWVKPGEGHQFDPENEEYRVIPYSG